jgi:hypothetical protein
MRTNNNSENNHSVMASVIPRTHQLVYMIVEYFKECDSASSSMFLPLSKKRANKDLIKIGVTKDRKTKRLETKNRKKTQKEREICKSNKTNRNVDLKPY